VTSSNRILLVAGALAALASCKHSQQSGILTPNADALAKPAPDSFRVAFVTSRGRFVVKAVRSWAPHGVDRFYYLVTNNYYDGVRFFRNLPGFVAQFGIHGDPAVNDVWKDRTFPDDSVKQSNQPGYVTFAMGGPNSRTAQLFINKRDNRRLDAMGFAPIGHVVEGMDVVLALNDEYGEGPPQGRGPDQERVNREGNAYLNRDFPKLDYVASARVTKD
jgi:peptidyl-prolyl cis-trans isomerase A (cyclophilin A)